MNSIFQRAETACDDLCFPDCRIVITRSFHDPADELMMGRFALDTSNERYSNGNPLTSFFARLGVCS